MANLNSRQHADEEIRMRADAADISVIIPAFNEAASIGGVLAAVDQTLSSRVRHLEIVVVDDGSRDGTVAAARDQPLKATLLVVQLSRNFGKENAISAGLAHASGDACIIMDADGQHPTSLLPEFLANWENGYDVVYGVRQSRKGDSISRRLFTALFYRFARGEMAFIERDAGDFRLLDRKVVEALNSLPERVRFMKGLYNWVGFSKMAVPYQPQPRKAGKSNFSNRKLFYFGLMGITSFTQFPLRLISAIGLLLAAVSMGYGVFILVDTLLFGIEVPGWATITAGITLLGGIQLLSMGILGQYIGHLFLEAKSRPLYIVKNVARLSPVLQDSEDRRHAAKHEYRPVALRG